MSYSKRRLTFASPLVITALLAPACSHPSPQHPQPPGSPDAQVVDAPVADALPAAPVADGTWSKVDDHWVYTYTDPRIASIDLYPNGACWFDTSSICTRDEPSMVPSTCNPPPPQPVQCPADAPK